MSLSEALGPFPVVHHFYPIDPQTYSQQQSAVYNKPDSPFVGPIVPPPSQEQRARPRKRRLEEEEEQVEAEILSLPSEHRRSKSAKLSSMQPQGREDSYPRIWHAPHRRQRMAHVEIVTAPSFNYTPYKPFSLSSFLGRGQREKKRRIFASPAPTLDTITPSASSTSSSTSDTSDYSDSEAQDNYGDSCGGKRKREVLSIAEISSVAVPALNKIVEDDGTTCHQCRRKTTSDKMRCRRLREDGNVCSLYFCQNCIDFRYDEQFDPLHRTWYCPRCRGMCNCSICLRKAGLGFVLDGPAAEQLSGRTGRLSKGKRTKFKPKPGQVLTAEDKQEHTSVRSWLARRGIALGSDEWMKERRQQGVRFIVGKKPPSLHGPSSYMEARLNPTLNACEEYHEDDADGEEDIGFPLDPRLRGEGGMATRPSVVESSAASGSGSAWMLEDRNGVLANTAATSHDQSKWRPPQRAPLPSNPLPPHTSTEDLPGLSPAQTYHMRLIVGRSLPRPARKRGRVPKPKPTFGKPKLKTEHPDTAYVANVSLTTTVPARLMNTRVHARPRSYSSSLSPIPSPNFPRESSEGKESFVDPASSLTFTYPDDLPSTPPPPPPPPEPVLVPTEDYTPSKLDITHVKDPHAQFGHSYWAFNAFNSASAPEPAASPSLAHAHARAPPLYSHNDAYLDAGTPSYVGSGGSLSLSHSDMGARTPNNASYMTSHARTREPGPSLSPGFAASGLSSFALDNTWMSEPGPSTDADALAEGYDRAVRAMSTSRGGALFSRY